MVVLYTTIDLVFSFVNESGFNFCSKFVGSLMLVFMFYKNISNYIVNLRWILALKFL